MVSEQTVFVDPSQPLYNLPLTMKDKINKIRNPDFSEGRQRPIGWTWKASTSRIRWRRDTPDEAVAPGGMTIDLGDRGGTGLWEQVLVCKPGEYYRVEADATCNVTSLRTAPDDDPAGLVIMVEPVSRSKVARTIGTRQVSPAIQRSTNPVTVRATYKVPDDVRRLRLSVGVENGCGIARIQRVRFIPILEPDETSHPLAVPPPPYAVPIPRIANSVCVCSDSAAERPLTSLLTSYFKAANVRTMQPRDLRPATVRADALFLPDAEPPGSVRSLTGLVKLAEERIVVISLPAFSALTRGALSLRRVEQGDDPINAKVYFANHATHGFALHDVFPYAWAGRRPGSFVQQQFRNTGSLKAFLRRHGFEVFLLSMCDQDVTSERPIALYKSTSKGGLYVVDVEPSEVEGTTYGEPVLAVQLLLNILGQMQGGLGRYCSAVWTDQAMRELIREAPMRLAHFVVHESGVSGDAEAEQLVTFGGEDASFGLTLSPKPMIVVRSGLSSGDAESFYGAFMWFKQFSRSKPYECAYAAPLTSRFRFAWIPHAAKWESRGGWRRHGRAAPAHALLDPLGIGAATLNAHRKIDVAALIDVVSRPVNSVRVIVPSLEGEYDRHRTWLPRLAEKFPLGRYFVHTVDAGEGFEDRDGFAWRHTDYIPQVEADPEAFVSEAHREVIRSGGQVVRIEVPGCDADFTSGSILRTDLVATLLEHVIGLQFGLIAVNRTQTPVNFDAVAPIAPGEALLVDRNDSLLRLDATRTG